MLSSVDHNMSDDDDGRCKAQQCLHIICSMLEGGGGGRFGQKGFLLFSVPKSSKVYHSM